jgi:integrase
MGIHDKRGIMSEDDRDEAQETLDSILNDSQETAEDATEEQVSEEEPPEMVLTDACRELLNDRQELLVNDELSDFHTWMKESGKNPENNDGLADSTASNNLSRIDQIYRQMLEEFDYDFRAYIPKEVADEISNALNDDELKGTDGEYSESQKRKTNDALKKYFEFRAHTRGKEEWTPPCEFNDTVHDSPDYLTKGERRQFREVVLTFDTIPAYSDCSPEQRSELKAYLAQKLEKPKEEVTPSDWKEHNRSWMKPSLVWTGLDAALRPIEVERAKVGWIQFEKNALKIPKEDAAKSRDNWEVALKPETVEALRRWLEQRKHITKYDDSDHIWLTREGNPWDSDALNYLFGELCDAAGIARENDRLSWYSIRHSVGEHMTEEGGLSQAKTQLRHKSLESTLQYADPSIENRQSTLDKME